MGHNLLLQTYRIVYTLIYRAKDFNKYRIKSYTLHFTPDLYGFNLEWFCRFVDEEGIIIPTWINELPDIDWVEYMRSGMIQKLAGLQSDLPYPVSTDENGIKVEIIINNKHLADIVFDLEEQK